MSHIEVKVGNKGYKMGVDEGQEPRVRHVASTFDRYVMEMMKADPSMDRDRVLVLAGIMMADEFLTKEQESDTSSRSLEAFHNSLAERLESLLDV